jgi:hypothetical protein
MFDAKCIAILIEGFPTLGRFLRHFIAFPQGWLYNAAYSQLHSMSLYNAPHGDILQHNAV